MSRQCNDILIRMLLSFNRYQSNYYYRLHNYIEILLLNELIKYKVTISEKRFNINFNEFNYENLLHKNCFALLQKT